MFGNGQQAKQKEQELTQILKGMSDKIEKSNKDITLLYSKTDKLIGDFSAALTVIRKRHNSALDEIKMLREHIERQNETIRKGMKKVTARNFIKFQLTPRQQQVYALKVKGMSTKQMASELKCTTANIRTVVRNIEKRM